MQLKAHDGTIDVGEFWSYRERAHDLDCPVVKAEIVQLGPQRANKVRVRMHGGEYPGLDFWVPKVRLMVPWDETEAWLRDERALEEASQASRGASETLECQAADIVFAAYPRPDGVLFDWPSHTETVCIFEPAAVAADLGMDVQDLLADPLAFIDRKGEFHAPARIAEGLARLLAQAYADVVLRMIADEEAQLRHEAIHGKTFGEEFWSASISPEDCARMLHEREPLFAQVREWCGRPAVERFDEIVALRGEVARIKAIVGRTASHLDEADRPQLASRLRASLRNPEPHQFGK